MKYRKKLIEVALPLDAINAASVREKSIRHGHPSTLHLWWARRPLATCRAILFSALVNDPDDDPMYGADGETAAAERARLFTLIEELVLWENSNNPDVINRARLEIARSIAANKVADGQLQDDTPLVAATSELGVDPSIEVTELPAEYTAHDVRYKMPGLKSDQVNHFLRHHAPPVLDPFAGGGSIPLEAQRLGLRAFASDLNPVPVLITKALVEFPSKFSGLHPVSRDARDGSLDGRSGWMAVEGMVEDVRYYGGLLRKEAEKRIGHLYPKVSITERIASERPDLEKYVDRELTVVAWLWARTAQCSNPACQSSMPLLRSCAISSKRGRLAHVEPLIDIDKKSVRFRVVVAGTDVPSGTVQNRAVNCLFCGETSPLSHIRSEAQCGRLGRVPIAIVADGDRERVYLETPHEHWAIADSAQPSWKPDELVPTPCHDVDRLPMYGMYTWGDAFTDRQLVALTTFSSLITDIRSVVIKHARERMQQPAVGDERGLAEGGRGPAAYADAIGTYLSFLVDQVANHSSTLCGWNAVNSQMRTVYSRQAIQMTWDYAESNPFSSSSGSFQSLFDRCIKGFAGLPSHPADAVVQQLDAADAAPECFGDSAAVISTDPPYYDNISYSDVSDFFYVGSSPESVGEFVLVPAVRAEPA